MTIAVDDAPGADGAGRSASILPWPGKQTFERMARSPQVGLPIGKDRRLTVHTDRVRAPPALSPTLSMNIGLTAIGLGVWGLMFPRHVKSTLGIDAPAPVVQAVFGAREMWTGFTLAGDPTRNEMLWTRLAGDLFDIAVLKSLDRPDNPKRGNARIALGLVLAVTALDAVTAARMTNVRRNDDDREARR